MIMNVKAVMIAIVFTIIIPTISCADFLLEVPVE